MAIDAGPEGGQLRLRQGLVECERFVGWKWDGEGISECREVETRPTPVRCVLDDLRADGIEQDIAENGEQVMVLLNRETLEAPLPDMAMTAVVPMIAPDMTGHPPLHEGTERARGGGLHDEVKMIGHQADAEELDGVGGFRGGEQVEKGGVIAVLVEDRGTPVPPIEDMVGVSSRFSTRNSRHEKSTVRETGVERQEKVACPLFFFCVPFLRFAFST